MSITDLIASSIGTSIAEIITLPTCTIKTNYQTNLNYKSIIDVTKDIYKQRGVYGFYNASAIATLSQIVSTSTKFTSYNYIKNYRQTKQQDIKNNIINGAIGGIVASVFSHPFDVIKVHQQTNVNFTNELKKYGPQIFYRGYSKSVSKNIILTSLIFPFYDFYKSKFNNPFISAGLSAFTVTTFLHPIDYLKVRHISNQPLYTKHSNLLAQIRYYYRGLHINLIRVIPHFMITMVVTEYIKEKQKI
jgi:hypothetical protein